MFRNVNAPPNVSPVLGANVGPQPTFAAPAYCYTAPVHGCNDFVLIVVLFILLIIVGASLYCSC